jgi:hypothetical protein
VNGNRGIHVVLPLAPLAGLQRRPSFLDSIETVACTSDAN